MTNGDTHEFQQRIARIETLVRQLEGAADPTVREAAREMVRALLELHGVGIGKLLARLADVGDAGRAVLDGLTEDELLASLLVLHDLHPRGVETRVAEALEKVRPYLQSHGGDVMLIGVRAGVVQLRLQGQCGGCPSSSATLKSTVERAIFEAAPDVAAIEVEGADNARPVPAVASSAFVQVGLPDRSHASPSDGSAVKEHKP